MGAMDQQVPAGAVLLAAGRGSRMAPITDTLPKPLLPIGGRSSLDRALDALSEAGVTDVVVVTGYEHDQIRRAVESRGQRGLRTVHNEDFADDVNILSTQVGVDALKAAERGYMIIETDIVMERRAWKHVLALRDPRRSFWVTHGVYGAELFGGAALAGLDEKIEAMIYTRNHRSAFDGWSKLLGMVYVGSDNVEMDRKLRTAAIRRTTAQYYMNPWVESRAQLPADRLDISQYIAGSFNDRAVYERFDALAGTGRLEGN